jgi:HK97 family phage major capsid protein
LPAIGAFFRGFFGRANSPAQTKETAMDPNQLRQQAKAKLDTIDAIENSAKAMGRALTAEEQAKIDTLTDEATALKAQADKAEADERASAKRKEDRAKLAADLNTQPGRKTKPADEPAASGGSTVEVKEPEFTKDPMKGFASPKAYFKAVMDHGARDPRAASDERLKFLATAGSDEQQSNSDPYGGFLVPIGMSSITLKTGAPSNPIAGRTTDVPMQTPTIHIPARTDKTHTTSVSGGLVVSRKAETAAQAASRMEMEQIELKATSLFGLSYITEELLTDSPLSVAALISAGFDDEYNSQDLEDFLRGTGVGEPLGIFNSPAKVAQAAEGGQSADTISGTNIVKMRSRCWRYDTAIWLANPDTYPQLVAAHVAGTNASVFLFSPARGEDVPDTLLGRPIFFTEYASTLGDEGDLSLVVPSEYLTGTYQPLESAESIHVRFDRHERVFKFWKRNAGAPWWRTAVTPRKGANTLSPVVTLAAR